MNKKVFILLLFLAATGMTTGCFFQLLLSDSVKEELVNILGSVLVRTGTGTGTASVFSESLMPELAVTIAFLMPAFLLPLLPWLVPIPLSYLFFKGFAAGFSSAMILESMGLKGLFYIAVTLIPAELLEILLFALLTCFSIHTCQNLRHRKKSIRKAPQIFTAGPYLYTYAAGLGLLILILLLQSALLAAVTEP